MDQATGPQSVFSFGPFRYDAGRDTLWRDGTHLPLGSRAARVLAALLANAPDVVSKRELMEAVWPSQAVEEGNLTVQVSALRRCLGPQAWIATVPSRGYRFQGAVSGEVAVVRRAASILPGLPAALPLQPTSFVGRETELSDITTLLGRSRLVTLVGAGGVGKTRLALQAAEAITGDFADGVRLVELASLPSAGADVVIEAVGALFGLSEEGRRISAQ